MASLLEQALARELGTWEAAGLRRTTEAGAERPGLADLASNDYLSLARHPEVVEAARRAVQLHGAGARAARLLGGGSPLHEEAEHAAAAWCGAEAALLFPTGYQANLGLVGALAGRGDAVVSDERVHASLVDAARLSRARVHVHAHLDLDAADRALARERGARRRLVLTEGVFSMDGDRAPLAELHDLCAARDAWLVVDEAHAAGLLGPGGAGAWSALGRSGAAAERLAARVVTGGKALGVAGAFVVGGRALRELLVNRARAFVFATAPPPAVAGALARAIELARRADEARGRALSLARAAAAGLGLPEPAAAVVPVLAGEPARALAAEAELARRGLGARAVRPPTVPAGTSRLRLSLHAHNSGAEVEELVRVLRELELPRTPADAPPGGPRPLVVVGTDTGVGKTVVAALLFLAARRAGPARYWKPVQTGADDDTEAVARLTGASPHECLRPAWRLPLPASPHEAAAAAGLAIDPERIEQGLAAHRRLVPEARLVVELAGGLLVPYRLEEGATQADWLARAAPEVVLVAHAGLGTLNHTLLTLEALRARGLEPRALFLVGPPHASNKGTLERLAHVARVVEVPPFASLERAALERWVDAHGLAEALAP